MPVFDIYQRPGFLLRRAHQISTAIFERSCAHLGLTPAQYGVLSVLRGTRAFQILAGLVLLSVMYLLSAWMGLSTLHWVLDNLVVYAVIGVLVLFAEDIRQVLATC